ncbi:MAG: translation initiation factor IF-2 [Candidatus Aminicenantes bacterium]|nr:translation initiation factor IF-2 [Candidatus Aminicenantes bacterium]
MQSIKLHEATKQFNISNKLAMYYLDKKKVPVKSHSSVISMEQLELLREFSSNQDKYSDLINEFNKPLNKKKEKKPEPTKEKKGKTQKKEPGKKPDVLIKKKPKEKETEIKEKISKKPEPEKKLKTTEREEPEFKQPEPAAEKIQKKEEKKPEPKKEKKGIQPSKLGKKQKTVPPPVIKSKEKPKFENVPELIQISDFISFKELCEKLNLKLKDVGEKFKYLNREFQGNELLSLDDVKRICGEFKVEFNVVSYEDYVFFEHIKENNAKLIPRAPVVTVMGHVDHGKTTLLDHLRKTRIATKEAGGITQKIGAYTLKVNKDKVIFIDTPGHEAFTNLRARGAKVTDIVILVVAANEGVKPQTIEAINHALAAKVPIIVAINKMDLEGADPDKVKKELSQHNILVENWGGDIVSVEISAKTGNGLDNLLEMITLVAEMQELKAYQNIPSRGTIIESRLDPQLGPIATVLIQHGRLKRGYYFICGDSVGKVKSIFSDKRETFDDTEAPMPVEIMGFENVPNAGDKFQVIDDIEKARKVIGMRKFRKKENKKEEIIAEKKLSLENLFKNMDESKVKVFSIIIKTDNYGSGEVTEKILQQKNSENLKIEIIHKGIGNITEGDILLASTADAFIIGFNIKAPQKVLSIAKREKIEIKLYNVIYHLIEDMEKVIKGEVEPEYVTNLIGKIEVLQKFKISKLGNVAGCIVKEGKVTNKSKLKVIRGKDLVFEGEIGTLKRIKDEASEVHAGTECGIKIKNFNAIEVGDIIEAYELIIKE